MLSCNPRPDKFSTSLPSNFFIDSLVTKYNTYIDLQGSYFQNINQIVNESIMRVDIPGLSQTAISQTTVTSSSSNGIMTDTTFYPSTENSEDIVESTDITLTFRHIDSYINYFFLLETFYNMYFNNLNMAEDRFTIPVICMSTENHPVFIVNFGQCIFTSIDGMPLAYDTQGRDFKEFKCTFTFSDMNVSFDLPQGTAKTYL